MSENYRQLYEKIKHDDEELQIQVAKAVHLSPGNLMQAAYAQSSISMTWSYLSSFAADEAGKLKFELEDVLAPRLRSEARALAPKEDPDKKRARPKVTQSEAEDYCLSHPEYQALSKRYLEASGRAELLKKVEYAIVQKRDMIQTINSRERAEMRASAGAGVD